MVELTQWRRRAVEVELSWFWVVYPGIVGLPSANEVLELVCGGLSGPSNGRVLSERVSRALADAVPVRAALGALTAKHRETLRLAFDLTAMRSRNSEDAIGRRWFRRYERVERGLRARMLMSAALRAYARERWG
jgi:hypothetical protein